MDNSANFIQVAGPAQCIRCDFTTQPWHDTGMNIEEQQEVLMDHLDAEHKGWETDRRYPDMRDKFNAMQVRAEHQRLQSAVVESLRTWRKETARLNRTVYATHAHELELLREVNAPLEPAVDVLMAFEAEHKIGGK